MFTTIWDAPEWVLFKWAITISSSSAENEHIEHLYWSGTPWLLWQWDFIRFSRGRGECLHKLHRQRTDEETLPNRWTEKVLIRARARVSERVIAQNVNYLLSSVFKAENRTSFSAFSSVSRARSLTTKISFPGCFSFWWSSIRVLVKKKEVN